MNLLNGYPSICINQPFSLSLFYFYHCPLLPLIESTTSTIIAATSSLSIGDRKQAETILPKIMTKHLPSIGKGEKVHISDSDRKPDQVRSVSSKHLQHFNSTMNQHLQILSSSQTHNAPVAPSASSGQFRRQSSIRSTPLNTKKRISGETQQIDLMADLPKTVLPRKVAGKTDRVSDLSDRIPP